MTLNVELLYACLAWVTPAQAASLFWASNSLQEVTDIAAKIKVDAAAQ